MKKEIEHKFLIDPARLPKKLPAGSKFVQGYLCARPTVRVRISSQGKKSVAYLTIKGSGLKARDEFEYDIPVDEARKLIKLCGSAVIEKTRYVLDGWEIDEFHGRQKGLWMAEYELASMRAKLPPLPDWITEEVTGNPEYSNSSLAIGVI